MGRILGILLGFCVVWLNPVPATASKPAYSVNDFCELRKFPNFTKELLTYQGANNIYRNILSFKNEGGLFGGGVCWWHSRFTRAAAYLTYFRPDLPKPSAAIAKQIIGQIARRDRVVMIPGYLDLWEFSQDWRTLIQKQLEKWQKVDGFLGQSWLDGLAGKTEVSPGELEDRVEQLYYRVNREGDVVYTKLQVPGIAAHSWLVVSVEPTRDGYDVTYLDSNYYQPYTWNYRRGMTFFSGPFGKTVPYLGKEGELRKMKAVGDRFCRRF